MQSNTNRGARFGVVLASALAAVLFLSTAASAHDPIFLEKAQTTADTGPYMPDGTISWALYGSVLETGDARGFEFDLRDGDELYVSLLIPNIEPELSLDDAELPTLQLDTPSGERIDIIPEIREVFDEPFSNTSYVTLAEIRQPGEDGRYQGVVLGNAASRFTVAIGEREIFFTETERSGDRPSSFPEISEPLKAWYSTPPGEEPVLAATADGEGEIQMDLIDEAMETGEANDTREDADSGGTSSQLIAPLVVAVAAVGGFLLYRRRGHGEGQGQSNDADNDTGNATDDDKGTKVDADA